MPAVSKKQQRFFGIVRAAQKGTLKGEASPQVQRVAASIKKKDAKDFASTKHKGLPMKKEEVIKEEEYDRWRDRQLERGTYRSWSDKNRPVSTGSNTAGKKKPSGKSALDIVKKQITDKYGKGAIMDVSKKKKNEEVELELEAKVDTGKSPEKKEADRNLRKFGVKGNEMAHGKLRRALHRSNRGDKKIKGDKSQYVETEGYVGEAKVDEKTPEHKRATVRDKRYGNPHGSLELGGGIRKDRRADHEARRGVKKEEALDEVIKMSRAEYKKIHKDFKSDDPKKPRTTKYEPGKGTVSHPVQFTDSYNYKRIIARAMEMRAEREGQTLNERGDYWHPDPEKDKKLGGPGANARAREDRADAAKPKEDPKKLRKGESYMDYAKRQKSYSSSGKTPTERLNKLGANIKKKEGLRDKIKRKLGLKREQVEGKSFAQFLEEGNRTGRMMQKSKTQVTGHISADRGSDEKKNREGRKTLEKDLKKHGIGHKKGVGEYKYDSGETGREVSYQTSKPDKMSKRRFGKVMRRLGRKHGQESVITKDKDKSAKLHYTEKGSKQKSDSLGKTKAGKHPKGYGETSGTKARGGKLPKKTNKSSYHYG